MVKVNYLKKLLISINTHQTLDGGNFFDAIGSDIMTSHTKKALAFTSQISMFYTYPSKNLRF